MATFFAVIARLDDHWIGDLIGVIALFGGLSAGLFLVLGLGGGQ